ncbi:MAG: alcohol dehydrogenase catalytic domain-containing protein [Planctomycetes bacterium]|nr:alcohol dehydrogenase catalytic domain-containing protein [Planctomycetota bacterium]
MRAAPLHGPRDIRLEDRPRPAAPGPVEVQVRVTAVGICGSDLHTYLDGRIGDTELGGPLVLGHEFAGVVEAAGPDALDGAGRALSPGTRVAVDPAQPCNACESCRAGHPNLCPHHRFVGVWPTQGALQDRLNVPADTCFRVPDAIDDVSAAMLEPLGVALHAVDLAHLRVGHSVAIIGCGSIGLLCGAVAGQAGAAPLLMTDRLPARLDAARRLGAQTFDIEQADPVEAIMQRTGGRGVDVALECAWSTPQSVAQAVEVLRPGGRLVVVGIASDDTLTFNHSAVRRKGLTIALCRRMKHTYPRAIRLVSSGTINVSAWVTHRLPLEQTAEALDLAATYRDGVIKAMVELA